MNRRWTSPNNAIANGAATKSLYRWLSTKNKQTPDAEDLWKLCRDGSISTEYLMFERGEVIAPRDMPFGLAYGEGEWGWNAAKQHELSLALLGYLHAAGIHQAEVNRADDLNRIEAGDNADDPAAPDDSHFRRDISDAVLRGAMAPLQEIENRVRAAVDAMIDRRIADQWRRTSWKDRKA